jgi:hypothetical protein
VKLITKINLSELNGCQATSLRQMETQLIVQHVAKEVQDLPPDLCLLLCLRKYMKGKGTQVSEINVTYG